MVSNISWGADARALNGTSGENSNATSLLDFRNFISEGNIRPLLGTNSHLSDNKILRSWQYMFFMLSYCVICSLIGILSVTLLPDPNTLEAIRAEDQPADYEETMEAAAHNLQGAYETYGDSSYQYLSNDLALQQSDEYGDHTSNYISPERTKRYSRSMTGARSTAYPRSSRGENGGYTRSMEQPNGGYTRFMEQPSGYTRSMEQQNGGYIRSMEQQNGGYSPSMELQNGWYRRSSEQQNNGYQRPIMQQSSSYSSVSTEEGMGYNRPMKSQYRATPRPPAEMQNNGYPESGNAMENGEKMPSENTNTSYSGSTEASNSTTYDTTEAPGDTQEEVEDEDIIPNYGFLENSLYAKYLEFYNKQKDFLEEHFGYSKKGKNKKKNEEDEVEMNEEVEEEEKEEEEQEKEEEEPLEGGYTEQPMEEEASEDGYSERPKYQGSPESPDSERPLSQQPPTGGYKRRPTLPPPTHWVLVPQQYRPPYHSNRFQAYPSRVEPQQQESQSQRYRPQPQKQDSQPQKYTPQPQRQESQSQRHRPQSQRQEPQSLRHTDPQSQTLGSAKQNGRPSSHTDTKLSSHFQKVYLSSDESPSDLSTTGVAYSGQYSNVNGSRDSQRENHASPSASRGGAQGQMEPTESSYLSYKPHSEK